MKKFGLAMVFVILAVIMVHAQESSVPPLVNYQGMLADSDGKPLTGTKKLAFNLYDAATGGNKVWGPQIFSSVPLVNGMFNVILGTTDTAGRSIAEAFGGKDRYLGIEVDEGSELAPRQQILSAPFAIHANDTTLVQGYNLSNLIEDLKTGKVLTDPSVKPGLPDADYDSGWFSANNNSNYDQDHNMGALPRLAIIWAASDDSGSNMYMMDSIYSRGGGEGYGSWLQRITDTSYRVSTGPSASMSGYGADGHWNWGDGTGWLRVLMWK